MGVSITIKRHWRHWDVLYKFTTQLTGEQHGVNTHSMGGMSALPRNIIAATSCMSNKQTVNASPTPSSSAINTSLTHLSRQKTDSCGDLKHKLQRTNNVDGYKQLAALKRLDDVHHKHTKMTVNGKVSFTDHPTILRFNPAKPPADIAAHTPRVTIYRRPVELPPTQGARPPTGPAANTRSSAQTRQHALSTMEHNLSLANETIAEACSELACAAVMDEHGNMLQYHQLMTHPKYKKEWSISSANKFGQLA